MEQLVSHTILRDACALLNPKRAEDLTREDIDLLKHAEKAFLKRKLQVKVSEEIHDMIVKRVAQLKLKSREYYKC